MTCQQNADVRHQSPNPWIAGEPGFRKESKLALEAGQILEGVRVALGHDLDAATKGAARLAALLGRMSPDTPRGLPARGGLAPWQQRKVQAYIETRLDASILIEDLAGQASLSPSHFCRAFKESFGDKPHAYVMRLRVERARELMLTTRESLSQIALACGLSDQAHLTKLFRRATGETPGAWRRSNAAGA